MTLFCTNFFIQAAQSRQAAIEAYQAGNIELEAHQEELYNCQKNAGLICEEAIELAKEGNRTMAETLLDDGIRYEQQIESLQKRIIALKNDKK